MKGYYELNRNIRMPLSKEAENYLVENGLPYIKE